MTFAQLEEHGIRFTIRRSSAEVFVAQYEQVGVSLGNGPRSIELTCAEALQLIGEGATDAAGLTG
jgi:hypothetical protein